VKRVSIVVTLALSLFAGAAQPALAAPATPPGPWTDSPTILCILGYHLPQHPVFGWYLDHCVRDGHGL
jgi:hypothetical protein